MLTMLRKTSKQRSRKEENKSLKKQNSYDRTTKLSNRRMHDSIIKAKVAIVIYTLEFFETVNHIFDYMEEHLPDDYKTISHLVSIINDKEQQWRTERFGKIFYSPADRNNLSTLVARHFYNEQLLSEQERIAKCASMRAVRSRHHHPYLLGICIRLEIILEMLISCHEKQYANIKAAYITNGVGHKYSYLWEADFGTISLDDPEKLILPIIDKLLSVMDMKRQTYEFFIRDKKIGSDIFNYSKLFYDLYSRYLVNETQEICSR